ncbi:MAG TPA: HAMP domain-containing sensor histidine kinase [Acidimicrobiales bacterium]|nr:HAMP domain-containing sensor histidine kinase [Acidimicrobiales bacterium]
MSLRTRLLAAVGVVALVALIIAGITMYTSLSSFLNNRVDQTLQTTNAAFGGSEHTPGFGPPPGGTVPGSTGGGQPPTGTSAPRFAPGLFVERITAAGVTTEVQKASEPGGHQYTPSLPANLFSSFSTKPTGSSEFLTTASSQASGPQFRVLVSKTSDGDLLVIGQTLDSTAETLQQLLWIDLAVTGGALIVALLLGLWLVRVGLRPLREVELTAEAIAEGDLTRRVPGEEQRTEVGRLARVLNMMLGRIQRAFADRDATEAQLRRSEERLRRFVADASHELRTPVAAVSAYAELYARGAAEHPEDVGRFIAGIQGESERMKRLIEDLLLLARLDEGLPIEHQPVELVSVVAEAIEAGRAVGPEWPLTLRATGPVEVLGDRLRLRQVVDNLLSNVRAHAPAGTHTVVSVTSDGATAVVEVADDGPGLSAEQAAQVFERFYRADPSRTRTSGGSGLGLSIVWSIVTAHYGTIVASPGPAGGAVFTVTLPASTEEMANGSAGEVADTPTDPAATGTPSEPTDSVANEVANGSPGESAASEGESRGVAASPGGVARRAVNTRSSTK